MSVENTPELRGGRRLLWLLVATLLLFFAWAGYGRLDVVSLAEGEVVPSSRVKRIQHLEGGIVREIRVKEGERIGAGQPLVELEPTRSGAELGELEVRLASLDIELARLDAEVAGAHEVVVPERLAEAHPEMAAQARELFTTRRQRLANERVIQRELLTQRDREIEEIGGRMASSGERLTLVEEQIRISKKLVKLDLSNRMNHLNLLKEAADLRGRIAEDRALLPRAEAARNEARARLAAIETRFQEEAREAQRSRSRERRELHQRLARLQDTLRRTVLRSPVEGIVKSLHVATRGGVIQPGDTIADIVPVDDRLVIEAKLPTHDIGFVRPGQRVSVRLATAEAARFGTLEGEVERVSPDALHGREGPPYYRVRIRTERDHFAEGDLRYHLFPGMQVTCSIRTGSRTVLQYLLDPYVNTLGQALRER